MSAVVFAHHQMSPAERLRDAAWVAFVALILGIPLVGLTTVDAGGRLEVSTRFGMLALFIAVAFVGRILLRIATDRLKARKLARQQASDAVAQDGAGTTRKVATWLGWFALVETMRFPPLSIMLAWWCFGGLLMTGKRYSEFRFIDDKELSGQYRKSFQVYTDRSLIIAMITYANLFCFCAGWAMCSYAPLNNLVFVFPLVILAVVMYFRHAMSEIGARLEPEQLLQNKWIVLSTAITTIVATALLYAHKTGLFNARELMDSPSHYSETSSPESTSGGRDSTN